MRKLHVIVHPFLFAAYPILAALARNISAVAPAETIRPLVVVLASAAVLMLAIRPIVKDWDRAGFFTSLILLMALYYGYAYKLPPTVPIAGLMISRHIIIMGIWIVFLAIVGNNWVWHRVRPQVITTYLNLVAAVSLIFPIRLILIFLFLVRSDPLVNWTRPVDKDIPPLAGSSRPDIYYIIVDGYSRADVLQELYHFDNSAFLKFLTDRGFYVADQGHSNYAQTALSLASSLNLEYLDFMTSAGKNSVNRGPLGDLIAHSKTRSLLKSLGYQMVAFPTGYPITDVKDADLYKSPNAGLTEFEGLLLETSAIQIPMDLGHLDLPIFGYSLHRQRILYEFDQLANMPTMDGPKFVFAHIVAPHPPFVFDRNGAPIEPDRSYFIGDGTQFEGTLHEYIAGYTGQLTYVNTMLEKTIDALLTKSKTPPIIILQADHGPGALLDWNSADNTCLRERMSILNAYYMPGHQTQLLRNSITPVNSFRVMFDTYFGADFGLLEDKTYFSTWGRPYDFIDVGDRTQTQCTVP